MTKSQYMLVAGIYFNGQVGEDPPFKGCSRSGAQVFAFSSSSDLGARRRVKTFNPVGGQYLVNLTTGRLVIPQK